EESEDRSFLFGYEESYGYLIGDFVRDKDAVQACLMISEVAAFYKSKNMTLYDGLLAIFEDYGFYQETLEALTLKGKDGANKINAILTDFRSNPPIEIAGKRVVAIEDYQLGKRNFIMDHSEEEILLPKSNVLKFILRDGAWFCLRPSGTEPKIKFYFGVKENTLKESKHTLEALKAEVMSHVRN